MSSILDALVKVTEFFTGGKFIPAKDEHRSAGIFARKEKDGWAADVFGRIAKYQGAKDGPNGDTVGVSLSSTNKPLRDARFDTREKAIEAGKAFAKKWGAKEVAS